MSWFGRSCSVSSWTYVALAYTIVWGALAAYAVVLARRVTQARQVAKHLQETLDRADDEGAREEDGLCDGQPAP
jgi:hypothetical protein